MEKMTFSQQYIGEAIETLGQLDAEVLYTMPKTEFIWESPWELLNIFQADPISCHIITVTSHVLRKLNLIGKELDDYSLDTVKMFYNDAMSAGCSI